MSTILHNPGTLVGPYRLLEPIGTGLSGEVWTALSPDGSVVALKIFSKEESAMAQKEYETGVSLDHPHLLRPLSLLTDTPSPVMVLPYCTGRSVSHVAGHVTERMVWMLLRDIASVIDYLVAQSLYHGDIKPSNILWDAAMGFILSDFGACAPLSSGSERKDLSSYQFAPPEKVSVERSDIWSLGASVFHLVLGRGVFGERGGRGQVPSAAVPLMRRNMPELSALVGRCLSYDPTDRPSAGEVLREAERMLQGDRVWIPQRPLKDAPSALADCPHPFWPERMTDL